MATSSAAAAAAAADPSWCTPGVAAAFTLALAALGRARRYAWPPYLQVSATLRRRNFFPGMPYQGSGIGRSYAGSAVRS